MTEEGSQTPLRFAAPPDTGGRAARFGLIRPADDRRIAGVGAALGDATGTDPLLWRVLLAVMTVFAGAGVVLYLLCWLLFPARGDQTSPLGALVSSKKSSTSGFVALLLALGAIVIAIITFITTNGRPFVVFGFIAALVVVLTRRRVAEPAPAPEPVMPPPTDYTTPFAPHGPYANRTLDLPAEVPPPPPVPPVPPVPPQPPKPPKSSLGLVTFSLVVIVVGVAAILDMVGVPIPMASTLAVALLICGGGLLLGTWWGRGRGLIVLGVVLSLLLAAVTAVGRSLPTVPFTSQHTVAEELADIPPRLTATIGASELDLSGVEFADGDEAEVTVDIWVGGGVIVVGENVDVVISVDQQRSEVTVDGVDLAGAGERHVDDYESLGPDGEGGGRLVVTATVDMGSLEIER